jgi:hypothetical protein
MVLADVTTRRPGSIHDTEPPDDLETNMGKLMSALVRAEEACGRAERLAVGMRTEHETYTRTVVQLSMQVEAMQRAQTELLNAQRAILVEQRRTVSMVRWARNLAPFMLGLVEVARQLLAHMGR